MSLLMVKTRDLSWQDRTVNVELMLAPGRNQLLMNKHKTLGSKCTKAKRLYDKERESMLKNMVIEKRLMEKTKIVLLKKKSDIMMKRISSSVQSDREAKQPVQLMSSKRSGSAPAKLDYPKKPITSGVFLTEIGESRSRSVTVMEAEGKGDVTPAPSQGNLSMQADSTSQMSASPIRVISPFGSKSKRIKSVRFDDRRFPENQETQNCRSKPYLEAMVHNFVKTQIEFNERPTKRQSERVKGIKKNGGDTESLIAKRYTNLSVDKDRLIDAFDNFCLDRNKDDFQKLVRLATKLKSSAKMARNQSIVPAVTAFRSGKVFMEHLRRPQAIPT